VEHYNYIRQEQAVYTACPPGLKEVYLVNIHFLYPACRLALLPTLSQLDYCHPLIAQLQEKLAARGLYTDTPDGVYNLLTQEAVTRFQQEENLPATGLLNPLTFSRLWAARHLTLSPASQPQQRAQLALPRANILIAKQRRQLTLFDGNTPLRNYPVAIGKPATPTPLGNYTIILKHMNPGGILGTRWLGLSLDSYGIHGTTKPWLIGQMVSNGCIRMHNAHVEEVFTLVRVGTPVYIRD